MKNQDQQQKDWIDKTNKTLDRPWHHWRRERIIRRWEEETAKQHKEIMKLAIKTREHAIEALLQFEALYVLEDSNGERYTQQRLRNMPHEQLTKLLRFYLEELRKDLGLTGEEKRT